MGPPVREGAGTLSGTRHGKMKKRSDVSGDGVVTFGTGLLGQIARREALRIRGRGAGGGLFAGLAGAWDAEVEILCTLSGAGYFKQFATEGRRLVYLTSGGFWRGR